MIKGKRVFFRPVEETDLPYLVKWLNDQDMARLVVGWTFPVGAAEQRAWFDCSHSDTRTQRWMVQPLDGDEPIGLTGLWDIDWHNRHALSALKLGSSEIRGKGYGQDAIYTLMAYAYYQVGLNRLWGDILVYNKASYRAYVEKCGWRVEGVQRQHVFRDGQFHDLVHVAALRSDFEALSESKEYRPVPLSDRIELPGR